MCNFELDYETFGDSEFRASYGRGYGGNGEKNYHVVLDITRNNSEDDYVIIAMTPEDAERLSEWLKALAITIRFLEGDYAKRKAEREAEKDEPKGEGDGEHQNQRGEVGDRDVQGMLPEPPRTQEMVGEGPRVG